MGSQQNDSQWSTEWPTEPGWYWFAEHHDEVHLSVAKLEHPGDRCVLVGDVFCYQREFSPRTAWYPIEPPDLGGARKALRGRGVGAQTGPNPFKAAGVEPEMVREGGGEPPREGES